jgi:transmembrane sensor
MSEAAPPAGRAEGAHERAYSWRRSWAAAAACAFLVTVAGAMWWNFGRFPLYATDVGERRSLTLADGSTVDLNARSSIRVEFSKKERRVELVDGQALFQVAKDRQRPFRPFIVRSGDATVRAVGTQFDVNRQFSGVTITVLEGRVAVYSSAHEAADSGATTAEVSTDTAQPAAKPAATAVRATRQDDAAPAIPAVPTGLTDPSGGAAVFVSAGEQVTVTPQAIPEPQHADLNAATAWMQRRLTFDGTKLSDVVLEFNRYNRRPMVVDDQVLSDFHVSGVYSSTDPTSLIRFLREQPGIKVVETDSEVRITQR